MSEPRRRPALVTWLSLGVLTVAAVALSGLGAWFSLPDLPYSVPLEYLFLRNLLWGIWGAIGAFGAFVGRKWAPRWIQWGGLAVAGWYWADRLLLAQSNYIRNTWPLAGLFTLVAVLVGAWIFRQPAVRTFFEESAQ